MHHNLKRERETEMNENWKVKKKGLRIRGGGGGDWRKKDFKVQALHRQREAVKPLAAMVEFSILICLWEWQLITFELRLCAFTYTRTQASFLKRLFSSNGTGWCVVITCSSSCVFPLCNYHPQFKSTLLSLFFCFFMGLCHSSRNSPCLVTIWNSDLLIL